MPELEGVKALTREQVEASKQELQDRIAELEQENSDLNDQLDAIAVIVGSDDNDTDDQDDDQGNAPA